MAKQRITWTLEDHLCRECHGRVLRSASGVGATGGGNPLYRCADCGVCTSAMGPHAICWCGFEHRRTTTGANPYQCRPLAEAKDNPAIRVAFQACGYDPERSKSEVGILMPEYLRLAEERIAQEGA